MIKKKINAKLNEQKEYVVCINKKGLFSVAAVTALSMLNDNNKTIDDVVGEYAVLILKMDMKQKAAIELALSDYLVDIQVNDNFAETKTRNGMVYK